MSMTPPSARYKLAILRNEMDGDHLNWLKACEQLGHRVDREVINLMEDDWSTRVRDGGFHGLLTQPTGWSTAMKALYDERIQLIDRQLGLPMIPSPAEISIYENKRRLAHWLKEHHVPHPETHVFGIADEALRFVEGATFPLVAKTSLGAGGSGVRILRSADEARHYVKSTFHGAGAPRANGPRWQKPGFAMRALRKLARPGAVIERLREYNTIRRDVQRDHVLFQRFVPHAFEWRAVRIGDSYFAHKKLLLADKASGSLLKEYGDPPKALLDFIRKLTDEHGFRSVAIDAFEVLGDDSGSLPGYLVNEIQCVFGQSDPHQMLVGGVPGRYRHIDGQWLFDPGDFNRFESYLLRLTYFLDVLDQRAASASVSAASPVR